METQQKQSVSEKNYGMSPCCNAVLWTLPYEGKYECFKCGKQFTGELDNLIEVVD